MAEVDGQRVLTCITCNVWFQTADAQRQHYKTDWHRYNLKRKVAGLPPISAQAFTRRVHAQRAQTEAAATEAMQTFECQTCKKTFSSRNAHQNHINSKKHKEAEKREAARQQRQQEHAQQPQHQQQEQAHVNNGGKAGNGSKGKTTTTTTTQQQQQQQQLSSTAQSTAMETAKDEEEEEEEEEEEPVLELVDSLFDTYRADSFEENVEYMGQKHGFFIPHLEFVDDLQGLVRYLQLKVGNYFTCIWCNKACAGLEAVRQHMDDKGHKQVDYSDEGQLELGDFYDFSSTYPDNAALSDADRDASLDVVPVQDPSGGLRLTSGLALALPSGVSVAHRTMQRYHRQRFRREDTRDSVVIGRLAAQYKALGYRNPQLPKGEAKRDQAWAARQEQRHRLQVGVRQNNLHFNYGKFLL
ncbi:zinc finger protein [Salpingoeca rosetta]|uniref:Zinc finger protein n=1 Tax=Salpingoeca rosetta (strain ATCC 50818 / BSB-021) TaxID=946362 RepID=F2U6R6_SALR5|nr:zinc finger protein [Salpingoeca rosetta]EGD83548.1 zinc finger protein [Salpingoeca rosetta]|eukprot:XP_004995052.1 zinc finger protein [Salpingoeca rosetta]